MAPSRGVLQAAERERDAARASRDRFSFLAEVSRCLADSLDYETTLTAVAGMSLPYLEAWCIVDVVTEADGIRRLAVLHPHPDKQEAARELHVRYPPRADDLIGAPRVIRTGRPEMVFDVPDATLVSIARDPEHLALLRKLGVNSYVIAPMIARGQVLGAITFVTAQSGRRFGEIDVVMAEDLARRAAIAVDNARLHREAIEAHAAAEEALEARSSFLATITHEVRTPLNAIIGYMQLLELEVAGELTDTQRSYLERARDSGRHLLRLVEDVLDVSRMERGRLSVHGDVLDAAAAVRAAIAILRPQAAGKLISLTEESGGGGSLHFIGDEHRVLQVLGNLLENAIKFTPPGGRVALGYTLEKAGEADGAQHGWVVFRVRDTGRGVARNEAEAIFQPFVQGEAGLTRAHGGSGLGLTISRRLARLMGGDVMVEHPRDGEPGATFTFRLPAASPGQRPEGEAERARLATLRSGTPVFDDASLLAGVPHRTNAERAAARRGLAAAGEALLRELGPATHEFVRRARADAMLGLSDDITDVHVADHLATLLTDLANSLTLLGEASGEPTEALADGSKIQRLVGELHGAQRQRLGWTEEQLLRESEVLRGVCEEAILRAVGGDERAVEVATMALMGLLQDRLRACLSGFRAAAGLES